MEYDGLFYSTPLAVRFETEKQIQVLKWPVSIDKLLKTDEYSSLQNSILAERKPESTNNVFAALGHARLVTNGSQLEDVNNQPVIKDGIVGIHNGIIENESELCTKNSGTNLDWEMLKVAYLKNKLVRM